MPFAYYRRLSRNQQRVYRQSDEVAGLRLAEAGALRPLVAELEAALTVSFHTQGFYQRESSLVRQLLPPSPPGAACAHAG